MSRRYWSNEPSSYDDFLLPVAAIRTAAPCAAGPEARDGEWSAHGGTTRSGGNVGAIESSEGNGRTRDRAAGSGYRIRSPNRDQRMCVSQENASTVSGE